MTARELPTVSNEELRSWMGSSLPQARVDEFVEGPGIRRLSAPQFDVAQLAAELPAIGAATDIDDAYGKWGFGTIPVTRRPGTEGRDPVDLSGRFWTRPDASYDEVARDDLVDEAAYTELMPAFVGTAFEHVVSELRALAPIGRVRINTKAIYNCNSWHRDPEPRLHLPIVTNPGSMFIVNHHATHLPADGSVYFTDTRGYHSALNGGEHPRVHLVAAIAI